MELPPPVCQRDQHSICTESDWVQCVECAQIICSVHEEVALVRHAGKFASYTSSVCSTCVQMLFERGEVSAIRSGFQFINRY